MPTERCWKCHQMKQGVELCPSDDRLCPDCYKENERQLQSLKKQPSASETITVASACPPGLSTNGSAGFSDTQATAPDSRKPKPKPTRTRKTKPDEKVVHLSPRPNEEDDAPHTSQVKDQSQASAADPSVELTSLRQLVSTQERVIKRLQCQLNFVLSFLGITETAAESLNDSSIADEKLPDETHGSDILAATEIGNQAPWSQVVSKRQQHRDQDTL